jgi:hypothetical protein
VARINKGGMGTNTGVGGVITLPDFFLFINVKNEGEVSVKGRYIRTKFGYKLLYDNKAQVEDTYWLLLPKY